MLAGVHRPAGTQTSYVTTASGGTTVMKWLWAPIRELIDLIKQAKAALDQLEEDALSDWNRGRR